MSKNTVDELVCECGHAVVNHCEMGCMNGSNCGFCLCKKTKEASMFDTALKMTLDDSLWQHALNTLPHAAYMRLDAAKNESLVVLNADIHPAWAAMYANIKAQLAAEEYDEKDDRAHGFTRYHAVEAGHKLAFEQAASPYRGQHAVRVARAFCAIVAGQDYWE